jgi:hypothetical protein
MATESINAIAAFSSCAVQTIGTIMRGTTSQFSTANSKAADTMART